MMKNVNRAAAAVALLLATSGLAQAQDGVVLDYTKRGFRDAYPPSPPQTRRGSPRRWRRFSPTR